MKISDMKMSDMKILNMKILKISAFACIALCMAVCPPLFSGDMGRPTVYAEPDDYKPTATGNCGENAKWTYYDDIKVLAIEGTGAIKDYDGYGSLPWNSVADRAESVKVGEGITKIGRFGLAGFKNVTSVSLPSSLKDIEFNAFYFCPSLEELSMYDKVENIDGDAFTYCEKLKGITLNVSESTTVTGSGTAEFSLPQEIIDKGIKADGFLAQDGVSVKNESGNDITVNGVKIENGSSYPHTHAFLDKYETSPDGHRQVCGCGALSVNEDHEYKLTGDTKEEKTYKCSVCGFEKKETLSPSKKRRAGKAYYICLIAGTILALICVFGIILLNNKKRELKKRIMRRKKRMTENSQDENAEK